MGSEFPANWQRLQLSELTEEDSAITYGVVKPGAEGEIRFIRGGDIANGRILDDQLRTITQEVSEQYRRTLLRGGELLVSLVGNPGQVAIASSELAGANIARQVGLVRLSQSVCTPFIKYYLLSPQGQRSLGSHSLGSVQQVINLRDLKTVKVPLPPLPIQKAIAHILGTLDDKIELNRRMNETLEGMARAIFKSWFVDFDPVRAKATELCDEGILDIGDGYRAKNSELGAEGLPFARAGNLNSGFDLEGADRLCPASLAKAAVKISKHGDVAFTSKGTVGRIARVDDSAPQFVYAPQVCFWRSKDRVKLHPAVLYCWMSSDDFVGQVRSFSGQTDMAPYISLSDQRQILVPRFPASQAELGRRIETLLNHKALCVRESRSLAATRDALLPRLLSGELSLNHTGMPVKEAH